MKYIVILGDGMADYPVAELGGRTPLEAAVKPNIDSLAAKAVCGMVHTVPEGLPPGSDVANLSVMGYDPKKYYTGRSPLEAVSMGVEMSPSDVAFRCNLVTLSGEADYASKTMIDYSSDEISSAEAKEIIEAVQSRLGGKEFQFYPGVSYRHLMIWRQGETELDLTPPHDISDKVIGPYLPGGKGADRLLHLMEKSASFIKALPVNADREKRGLRPATSIWFWGHGKKPSITSFAEKYNLTGAVISAVDLTKGLGICAGMEVVDVPGATGNIHTNFKGKAEAALDRLEKGRDFVYVHVEAPDEAGHRGELDTKIKAIEAIDKLVVGTILEGLKGRKDYKIMILPDHPTPLARKTHVGDPVPFLIYDAANEMSGGITAYSEKIAELKDKVEITEGFRLMDYFIFSKI